MLDAFGSVGISETERKKPHIFFQMYWELHTVRAVVRAD